MFSSQNYNALGYDDKILDGFYDLYGILTESTSSRMPSLVDLQGAVVSDNISWEAVLVSRAADSNLLKLEQMALEMAVKSRSEFLSVVGGDLVRKLAALVSDYMGGPVGDPDTMFRAWKRLSHSLKESLGSMVLPLGSLTIGLSRHRALLFKVFHMLSIIHVFRNWKTAIKKFISLTCPSLTCDPILVSTRRVLSNPDMFPFILPKWEDP